MSSETACGTCCRCANTRAVGCACSPEQRPSAPCRCVPSVPAAALSSNVLLSACPQQGLLGSRRRNTSVRLPRASGGTTFNKHSNKVFTNYARTLQVTWAAVVLLVNCFSFPPSRSHRVHQLFSDIGAKRLIVEKRCWCELLLCDTDRRVHEDIFPKGS